MTPPTVTIDTIQRALALPRPGAIAQDRMATLPRSHARDVYSDGPPRAGAVLLALMQGDDGVALPLTLRSTRLQHHSGQISFPGGRRDPEDATLWHTALREAREEIALPESSVSPLGELSELYITSSHFCVRPFVGLVRGMPRFERNPAEVAEILTLPLGLLLDDSHKRRETWEWRGHPTQVPFYALGDHIVWGATAMMLSELEALLRAALGLPQPDQR